MHSWEQASQLGASTKLSAEHLLGGPGARLLLWAPSLNHRSPVVTQICWQKVCVCSKCQPQGLAAAHPVRGCRFQLQNLLLLQSPADHLLWLNISRGPLRHDGEISSQGSSSFTTRTSPR